MSKLEKILIIAGLLMLIYAILKVGNTHADEYSRNACQVITKTDDCNVK